MAHFILDVGVGRKVEALLAELGFDTVSMLDLDPRAADSRILAIAERENRMVITMDKDFGELVHRSGQAHAGVLLLRLDEASGEEKAAVVRAILESHLVEMEGKFWVFHNGRLRIREERPPT